MHSRGKARDFDCRAAVHHNFYASFLRLRCGSIIAHAKLRPNHLRPQGKSQSLINDAMEIFRGAEHVDHIDRHRDIGKPGIDELALDLLARLPGVDGNDIVAARQE
ncbi:hypothetical protein AJ87_25815 [Rhizobium yanglingense]|nr:hypothetical protein AJ87_25815 [Rhizobium yanglingense]